MSDLSTKRMMAAYIERSALPTQFLSGFFKSPRENFHTTEEVKIDIQRNGEDVAIVVQDLSVGTRKNEASLFSSKEFKPAIYNEEFVLNSFDLIKRRPGLDPFQDLNFLAAAREEFTSGMRRVEDKIRRSIELMAAQVLQTGKLTLRDASGVALYELDFKPKSSHLATAGTSWGSVGAKPLEDLESLADVLSVDGKHEPGRIILGKRALVRFLDDASVQKLLENRRMELGTIGMPKVDGKGGKFHGTISVGQYTFEIWSYGAFYKHPQTGVATYYVDQDNVIMLGDGRLDLTFGAIPSIVGPDPRLAPIGLGRVVNAAGGMDMNTNMWISPDGRNLHGSVAARPLTIPTAIDTIGRLDTTT